jgi:hypothetical protein
MENPTVWGIRERRFHKMTTTRMVVLCSLLLSAGLSSGVQAGQPGSTSRDSNADQSDRRQGKPDPGAKPSVGKTEALPGAKQPIGKTETLKGGQTIKGEVVRIDGEKYVIKTEGGKELSLTKTSATQMSEPNLQPGHLVETRVDGQNHILSISSADRRNDHGLESGNAAPQ